ncbi:MAG: serine/threonine-protein phosphatase [Candidatus Eremiobacteraeota bacterium]|nr:serine/threonine-protein phosphatase [Candidatus Eremiobacteraeota bacterium]
MLQNEDVDDGSVRTAAILASHLFSQGDRNVPGVSYGVAYRLAEPQCGGDIVDVYQFDNGAVALSIADISGKGPQAAVHAALIKYGLRAYASHGLTPEKTMRAMDRLYLENSTFEQIESFASVFFAIVDSRRRTMTYACAGHEPAFLVHPHMDPQVLAPTAPIIGVFDDQHHLFRQETVDLWPGSLLVAATDGVTETRGADGSFFGIDRLHECVSAHRDEQPSAIIDAILERSEAFSRSGWHDDVAILAARFA